MAQQLTNEEIHPLEIYWGERFYPFQAGLTRVHDSRFPKSKQPAFYTKTIPFPTVGLFRIEIHGKPEDHLWQGRLHLDDMLPMIVFDDPLIRDMNIDSILEVGEFEIWTWNQNGKNREYATFSHWQTVNEGFGINMEMHTDCQTLFAISMRFEPSEEEIDLIVP